MKIKFLNNDKPQIKITPYAKNKMETYVRLCNKEIGWLGSVTRVGNTFIIDDAFLIEQEVTHATCELKEDAILTFYEKRIEENLPIDNILLWGHSHVNMPSTPSGQDDATLNFFTQNNDLFIRLIMNKRGDVHVTLVDKIKGLLYEDTKIELYFETTNLEEEIKKEIDEKVKDKVFVPNKLYKNYKKGKSIKHSAILDLDLYNNTQYDNYSYDWEGQNSYYDQHNTTSVYNSSI